MKKLLCILLMMLLLPAAALAESDDMITAELLTLDMGDFTMNVFNIDAVQLGEKADGALWARIYPAYNENAAFHDTIQIVWYATDLTETIDMLGPELYGNAMLSNMLDNYTVAGIAATNPQLLSAQAKDGQLVLLHCMDMDYSGMGLDLQVTMWQLQQYYMTADGTYCFTMTADSRTDLDLLVLYLGTIAFSFQQ